MINLPLKEQAHSLVGLGLELENLADLDLSGFDTNAQKALRRKLSALYDIMATTSMQAVILMDEMGEIVKGQIEREGEPVQ